MTRTEPLEAVRKPRLDVLYVTESARSLSSPGRLRRQEALLDWLSHEHLTVRHLSILGTHGTRSQRISGLVGRYRAVLDEAQSNDVVIVEALALPHMSVLTRMLSRHRRLQDTLTLVDVCDSWTLQVRAMLSARQPGPALRLSAAWLASVFPTRVDGALYISERDLAADHFLKPSFKLVVPLSPNNASKAIEPYRGKAERLVIPADFHSPHNRQGLRLLARALSTGRAPIRRIETFGRGTPPPGIASHSVHRGWVPSILEVLRGNTVVFAANTSPAGIPNKIHEALTYGRPVLVGRTASQAFPGLPQVFPYENPHDIVRHLERLAFSDFEQEEPYTSVTMPRNSYETLVSVLPRR